MVSHRSLIDSKFPQVFGTFLTILTDLNIAIVCMVATRLLISKSSSLFINLLVTTANTAITIGYHYLFYVSQFFSIPEQGLVFVSLFAFFQFYSVVSRDSKVYDSASSLFFFFSFFFYLLSLGLVVWPRLDDLFLSQNSSGVCAFQSPRRILGSNGQISFSCSIPSWSTCLPSRV